MSRHSRFAHSISSVFDEAKDPNERAIRHRLLSAAQPGDLHLHKDLAAEAVRLGHGTRVHRIGGPRVLAMQIDGKLLPDRFALQRHRRFEHVMLNVLRQTAPALCEPLTKRPSDLVSGLRREFGRLRRSV
jgi:hypothetical protein